MAIQAHVEWLKEGVVRWNKRRARVKFSPDLSGVSFFELLPTDFRDSPKTSRTFERINLSDADLSGADLSRSNFLKGNFDRALLNDADMSDSNFEGAKFTGASLINSKVLRSIFDGAVFHSTILERVEFDEAELSGASFVAVDISQNAVSKLSQMGAEFYASIRAYRNRETKLEPLNTSPPEFESAQRLFSIDTRTPKKRYDVFFGTNRVPIIEREALTGFGAERSTELSYGLAEVIVPEGHRIGSLGSPLWRRLLNRKDDRLDIDSLISLNEELFFRHLIDSANSMKVKQIPTVFIHGFNNSFREAVLRAAQIGYDLGIGQGVGLFSWPSQGKKTPKGYSSDEATAEASKYLLADFIEKFVEKSPSASVNLIAHSMGCRCLLGALEVLSNGRKSVLRSIDQVIFAAADVDAGIMENLGKAASRYPKRTTSYVSDKDIALKASGWLHSFDRVGLMPPTFVMNGMDTIEVNDDDLGMLNHGYVGSSRTVLGDIFELLSQNLEPSKRFSLEAVSGGHWKLKD